MFLIDIIDYLMQFEFIYYVFGAFAFFGCSLGVKLVILNRGI